ncbi:MAG: hypothetical protein ACLTE2_09565 [Eubacteriales bacterium]
MGALELGFGIVLLVFAVGIIALVLLQEGQQQNENRVGGGSSSDTFLSIKAVPLMHFYLDGQQ